jgi:Sap-like sulfolipid-1-addressing protein
VQAQTLALALVAALYPVGLLAVSMLLAGDRPMQLGLSFLGGAATSLFVVGILVITVLHGAGLSGSSTRAARGGFQVGLGTAILVAAWLMSRRPARQEEKKEPAWQARLRGARPGAVFLTGAILYAPSGSYLGAVQQIATSTTGWAPALQLLVVIAIVLLTVEIPLMAYALAPQATTRVLRRGQGWIDRHGRQALEIVLVLIGGYLVIDGITLIAT